MEEIMPRLFMLSCNNSFIYARSIQRLGNYLRDELLFGYCFAAASSWAYW